MYHLRLSAFIIFMTFLAARSAVGMHTGLYTNLLLRCREVLT